MNILFIGDIFASPGRRIVADHLQDIMETNRIELAVANAENAAGGFGITPALAEELFALGLDVLTTGNHPDAPGSGVALVRARNGAECAVLNLQGRTYMPNTDCPFRQADRILGALDPDVKVRLVDFHAEVTSEKIAMGWYLDGRVSAVIGTHTHVPTADTRILPGGTAYQTDCGMTGPYQSVIGVDPGVVIRRFLTALPVRMEASKGAPELHAVIVDVDEASGKARAVRRHAIGGD